MNLTLYHLPHETDSAATRTAFLLADEVHTAGGALWTSLSHGVGTAYLVVALPPEVSLTPLAGITPSASVDDGELHALDAHYTPRAPETPVAPGAVVVPVTEPTEPETASEQSA